jgi:hypothetical protein
MLAHPSDGWLSEASCKRLKTVPVPQLSRHNTCAPQDVQIISYQSEMCQEATPVSPGCSRGPLPEANWVRQPVTSKASDQVTL